jgi:flavin reductase (DIM6/NTAB) family NADH-FMN oxidoreductase RutF/predicted ester cyclase
MTNTLKSAITDAWHNAWDRGDVSVLDQITAVDYRRRNSRSTRTAGLDAIKTDILAIRAAFPDLSTTVDHIVIDGDERDCKAAIYWHSTGTFTEPLGDVPPTGTRVVTAGSNLLTFDAGKIALEEATWDSSALLADLGLKSLGSAFDQDSDSVYDNLDGEPTKEALKAFNRQFITGVTVVTTIDTDGKPRGLAVNSYNSVSLEPPLVMVCVQKTSSTYPSLFGSDHLGINILGCNQRDTLRTFAAKGTDKFAEVEWHQGPNGSPLIDGSSASIEVEIKERFQALTHTIFVGRVRTSESTDNDPIIYKAGQFFESQDLRPLN